MRLYATLVVACAMVLPAGAQSNWFAPDAASKQAVEDALSAAQKANHRVIVIYDGGWCNLCAQMHQAAMSDADVPNLIHSGYELAHVTVEDFDALAKFAKDTLHAKLDKSKGLLATVLEKDGKVLAVWTAPRLMDGDQMSAARIKAQMTEFLVGAPASEVYKTALAALPAGKSGWVEFRADWCGWCKKMESFFRESDAAPVLAKYYSVITIDTEKNQGADELAKSLGAPKGVDGGIPWFAVVDKSAKVLMTSEGPKGNIGYPDTDVEVAHFMKIMKLAGMSADEQQLVSSTIAKLKAKDAAATTASHQ